ncbi:hypothetical protein [Paenibacillus wenxiniae]|uniref:Uncharacterized protein n=1 Tax=Paenibacillus wenxiniae TaxID=1636843 RepID=A0ABW4RJN6_9BACL
MPKKVITPHKSILNQSVSGNVYSPIVEDVYVPVSNDVYSDTNDQSKTNLETFNVDQLDQYPDVKKFIYDNGYEDKLKKPNETSDEIIRKFNLQSHTLGISAETEQEVGAEDAKRIMSAYGIEQPKNVVQNFEQFVIVERNNTISEQVASVSNVWYINYITTNAGFTVNVTNVGKDPLDSVSGVLRKFDLSAKTFT